MKRVVLMCLQTAQLETSPARYQLLEEMSRRGFETYVFLPGWLKNRGSYKSINNVVNVQKMSFKDIRNKIISINPCAVIATTYEDIQSIYLLPYIMKATSFYYYNLEIYTPYINKEVKKENLSLYLKWKLEYPLNKAKEVLYTRKVKVFTIQDTIRKKLSAKYFIHHQNTILIPNSYVFDASKVLSGSKEGVIYTGGIYRDFLLEQFDNLKAVKKVPVTFSGVIDWWCKARIRKLKKTNPNIEFIEQTLSIDEYTSYIQQYAVGLVWYSPLKKDESHYYIGLSSGKLFKHLSLGQPVIAVSCPGVTEVVKRYKLGVVIKDISELDDAYNEIMKNYSYYRKNVLRVYKIKFDFKKAIAVFLKSIEESAK